MSATEWEAVRLSLQVATVATVVSLPFGILIGLALARGRFVGRSALRADRSRWAAGADRSHWAAGA